MRRESQILIRLACATDSDWTDADAVLPIDYFAAIDVPDSAAACVCPFEHTFADDHECRWPALLYEWHPHHYVNGLRRAGSPYAWHTVGSTIAVHINHYAAVRGFPRRRAGEDFYLLNSDVQKNY